MYDFLSEGDASGPVGFNLMMLQSSLGYIMTKSVTEVRADFQLEQAQQQEKSLAKLTRYKTQLVSQPHLMVELCDCPFGCAHGQCRVDSSGRQIRRGDLLVCTHGSSRLHGIFYG